MIKHVRPIYSDTFKRRRRWRRGLIVLVLIVVVAVGIYARFFKTSRPSVHDYPVMGVRLDQSDGAQDFAGLKNRGVQFAYLKGTEGASYFDDNFASNFHRAIGSGVAVGVYHFFSFASTPDAQADYLIRQVGDRTGQLPLTVYVAAYTDLPKKKTLNANLKQLLKRLDTHYGQPCLVMGAPKMLRRVSGAVAGHHTIAVGHKALKSSSFWEYSQSVRIGDHRYRSLVYTGTADQFAALLPHA